MGNRRGRGRCGARGRWVCAWTRCRDVVSGGGRDESRPYGRGEGSGVVEVRWEVADE